MMEELLKSVSELKSSPSVIHMAIEHGHLAIVQLLLQVYITGLYNKLM